MRRAAALLAVLALPSSAAAAPVDEVDPRIGTALPGFVFPGAVVPFGMVQNSPDTASAFAYGGYLAGDPTIRGFSLVHLSGPGVPKAGDLPFVPGGTESRYVREHAEPGFYRVTLAPSGIVVELTATARTALQRWTFPAGVPPHVVADVRRSVEGVHEGAVRAVGPAEVRGHARGRYPVFLAARFDAPVRVDGTLLHFGAARRVTMRAGISFVDEEGAARNLAAEAPDERPFEDVRRAARQAWAAELDAVRITGGSRAARRAFHSALYRSFLHPNVHTDADGRHRGFDDRPHRARGRTHYANFSSWDLYKSHNQLLALLQPRRYAEMLRSLLDDARLGGRLPRWAEQTIDADHMSGDPTVPAIAEGVCRGLVDRRTAAALYRAAVDLQRHRPPALAQLGFLPGRPGTTLEYGVADFALALIAHALGRDADARRWVEQSLRYRHVQDPASGWVRPRNADGSWPEGFRPTDERGFQEGNSWQYSWLAPHDAAGLFARMGGRAPARLDQLFSLEPEVQSALNVFGLRYQDAQWAPGNEHDLHVPYLHVFTGRPWRVAEVLRDARRLYPDRTDGLPGNDDLGGLSAWHVLNALGFGPVTPGAPFWVLGSPQFPRAELRLRGGRTLVVDARGTGPTGGYVRGARLRGKVVPRAWITARTLERGGTLRLDMGGTPSASWGTEQLPPSASTDPLERFGCARLSDQSPGAGRGPAGPRPAR